MLGVIGKYMWNRRIENARDSLEKFLDEYSLIEQKIQTRINQYGNKEKLYETMAANAYQNNDFAKEKVYIKMLAQTKKFKESLENRLQKLNVLKSEVEMRLDYIDIVQDEKELGTLIENLTNMKTNLKILEKAGINTRHLDRQLGKTIAALQARGVIPETTNFAENIGLDEYEKSLQEKIRSDVEKNRKKAKEGTEEISKLREKITGEGGE